MNRTTRILALGCLCVFISSSGRAADIFPAINPDWLLLHEPAVIDEIKLSTTERKAFRELMVSDEH